MIKLAVGLNVEGDGQKTPQTLSRLRDVLVQTADG